MLSKEDGWNKDVIDLFNSVPENAGTEYRHLIDKDLWDLICNNKDIWKEYNLHYSDPDPLSNFYYTRLYDKEPEYTVEQTKELIDYLTKLRKIILQEIKKSKLNEDFE